MLSILTSLLIATTFSSAAPSEQLASTELSLAPSFRRSILDSDTFDFPSLTEDGSEAAILQERDNGDIAAGFLGWNSHVSKSHGLYQWIFGNSTQQYNISIDACLLKKDSVVGVWDFEDGTTKNDATVRDIMTDLGFGTPSKKYAARARPNALSSVKEAQAFSNSLVCGGSTPSQLENQADLRHLLDITPGMVTGVVVTAAYGVTLYVFYSIIALYVTSPVAKIILNAMGLFGILIGGGLIGIMGNAGDFAAIEGYIIGSVFVARMRQMILQATRANRAAGPCLPAIEMTAAGVQAAADAGQPAGDAGQAAAAADPALGVGSAVGTSLVRHSAPACS